MNRVASPRTGGRPRRSETPAAPADGRLVAERDALLRSLDDIEDERASGDLDDATYRRLRDDYTARVATLQRAIRSGAGPSSGSRAKRGALLLTGLVAVGVMVAVVLSSALGSRVSGGSASGNAQASTDPKELAQAVANRPNDVAARMAYARSLMPSDRFAALKQFDEAARLAPTDPEPRAYGGWMLYLLSRQLAGPDQSAAVAAAQQKLTEAITVSPSYPDARFFLGLVKFRGLNDPAGAIAEFDRFLVLAPGAPLAEQVRSARAEAQTALGS